jgi:RNA polymerase sigma factor (sigma-70 family)
VKGGERLKSQDNNHIRHRFDYFCKKTLKGTARDYYKKQKKLGEREISLNEVSEAELSKLAAEDVYPSDETIFDVQGEAIGIFDDDLADALRQLPQDKRDIVLLSYITGMTDKEIAERMDMVRRTVAHRRATTLQELKQIMEGNSNE